MGTLLAAHVDLSRFSAGWITLVVGFNTLAAIAIFGSRHWRHKCASAAQKTLTSAECSGLPVGLFAVTL